MKGRRARRTAFLLLAAGAAAAASAADAPGGAVPLPRIFPRQAEVTVEAAGLSRLRLPAGVLSACRPDLSDLRLFDVAGREVPFLLDTGRPAGARLEAVRRLAAAPLEAARAEDKRASGPPLRRETITVAAPPREAAGGAWDLIAAVRAPEFVARVRIEALDAHGAATTILDGASLFRLGGARPEAKDRLPLPETAAPRLRLTFESASPAWLQPALTFESARVLERGGTVAVPLQALSRRQGEGRTVLELDRPRGVVPDLLRLATTTTAFDRVVEVWDGGQGGSGGRLGSARLFRVGAPAASGSEEIPLAPARGDRLRVEIDDGDSPPLDEPAFEALVRQPSIVFSAPAGTAVLRFGGGRAHPPRYDLAGLLPPAAGVVTGDRAEAEARLFDPATVRNASLGPLRDNPDYDGAPALAFAMHPGAEIDRALFHHVRPLTVSAAPEGLSRLTLPPEDLSVLKEDGSDLRVVDHEGRQWPYLLEREAWMHDESDV